MFNRRFALIASVVAVVVLVMAASTQARSPLTRVNHLTFSGPVALPGAVLTAGTYTFESGPVGTDPNIVRVTTRNGQRVLYMGFTMKVSRPAGSAESHLVSMGEARRGSPAPIVAWFPVGSATGHEFLYR